MNFKYGLSEDGLSFQAKKFTGFSDIGRKAELETSDTRLAVIIDTETTGIDRQNDEIIEIALRQFCFNRLTGKIVWIGESYSELNQPKANVSEVITKITGLRNSDLKGKKIDWSRVNKMLDDAVLIIAHNAAFDRQFIDRYTEVSHNKIWACSFTQIDWSDFPTAKQGLLALFHGFFYESHRALTDIDGLIHLLSFPSVRYPEKLFLLELLENAKKKYCLVKAINAPRERKDILKSNGYFWDPKKYFWFKKILKSEEEKEKTFLEDKIYYDMSFLAILVDIPFVDNFKEGLS